MIVDVLLQDTLIPILLALATAAATWLATHAVAFVKRQTANVENQLLASALRLAGETAATAVAELAQTAVTHLKAAREDGKLTAAEARAAFDAAVERTWQMIGSKAREQLLGEFGSVAAAKTQVVGPLVEQAVAATPRGTLVPPRTVEQAEKEIRLARTRLGLGV